MDLPWKDSSKQTSRTIGEVLGGIYSNADHVHYAVVDAFCELAFGGNPAAVVMLPAFRDEEWMQSVAVEFNLPVTCFLVGRDTKRIEGDKAVSPSLRLEGNVSEGSHREDSEEAANEESKTEASKEKRQVTHEYEIRWFSPTVEVDICGHATLAATHFLYASSLIEKKDKLVFRTKSGLFSVRLVGSEDNDAQSQRENGRKMPKGDMIELNFPWITTTPSPVSSVQGLERTLQNVSVTAVGKANRRLIVELKSKEEVENLQPDMQELLKSDYEGLLVTSSGGLVSETDFIIRCFFPKLGVDEDSACGSAQCALGPYWSAKLGKTDLVAHQASKRGGRFVVQVDKKLGRVYIRGQASIRMVGVLLT